MSNVYVDAWEEFADEKAPKLIFFFSSAKHSQEKAIDWVVCWIKTKEENLWHIKKKREEIEREK